jgi:hypothetical protein
MALSDLTVRQAKESGTAYTLGDSDGLSLNVSGPGGALLLRSESMTKMESMTNRSTLHDNDDNHSQS